MDSAIVDPLVRKRNGIKAKLTKIIATVNKHNENPLDEHDVSLHIAEVAEIKRNFVEVQDKLIDLCTTDAESETQFEVSTTFDDKHRECLKALKVIQSSFPKYSTPPSSPRRNPTPHISSVKLPPIDLPSFSGRYEDWSSFEDLFTATIDKNQTISAAQKLQYLKSSLKGDPSNLIKSFQVTDNNYQEAWNLLKERYDNVRDIIQSILQRLFKQPYLSKESVSGLQALIDTTNECVRSLAVLKRPVEHWDDMLVYIVSERMDPESRRQWALTLTGTNTPTFKQLIDFMKTHVRGLYASSSSNSLQPPKSNADNNAGGRRQAATHHSSAEDSKCVVCGEVHMIFHCPKFKAMKPQDRHKSIKGKSICLNCLRPGHNTMDCRSPKKCKKCNKSHNTFLHFESPPSETVATLHSEGDSETQVLLATALVNVQDQSGKQQVCRVLIDGGSQATFITESCVKSLGLKRGRTDVQISGISSTSIGTARGRVSVSLSSCISNESLNVEALILNKVTGVLPRYPCKTKSWDHTSNLQLADPAFFKPGYVDILLGADVASSLLKPGIIQGSILTPIAQNTIFGWVLSGQVSNERHQAIKVHHVETNDILKKFWELEELPPVRHFTKEEKACEDHFIQTHTRDESGRYVVKLPFNTQVTNIGESRDTAARRLKQVERRLATKPEFKEQYNQFMKEYLELNHMEKIPTSQITSKLNNTYYLPHHFVLKSESTSTKFRVVFDGSAKTSSGLSLNNSLMVGPTIQDDLFSLLIRFRSHAIALKADISKMYRQFKVHDQDRDFQRILWRESPEQPLEDYRLITLTYGTAPAPYLATRCLKQLAEDESAKFPLAAPVLSSDFYVDDLMSGESTPERAIQLQQQLCALVKSGGMELCKWSSSDSSVLQAIPQELREKKETLNFDSDSTIKALGVKWNPNTDSFIFEVIPPQYTSKVTKRTVLSELAKVFDPLGWLSPTTIQAKIIFQDLWKITMGWDDKLPDCILEQWTRYIHQFDFIKSIQIPRCLTTSKIQSQQLHGFCDASEKAYAAAVYLRSEQTDGTIIVRLVTAKTKVAPIKQVSLPRLELCGAVMLSNLMMSVKTAMKIDCQMYPWTDSTIVLRWLAAFPGRWKTFVANRVAEIQDIIPSENWRHVISEENPADCASRGIPASELSSFGLWWNGPAWLSQSSSSFPIFPQEFDMTSVEAEEKKKILTCAQVSFDSSLLSRCSSLRKLELVTSFVFRFIHNCKKSMEKRSGFITYEERQHSLLFWISQVQHSEFKQEIKQLTESSEVSTTSKLRFLTPFIDLRGTLRVGGRLQAADLPESSKHQIILPPNNLLTKLIINHYHISHLHAGFQLLWSTLQQKFWILRARDTIRHEVRKCFICRRRRAETAQQLMGNLPSPRVNEAFPFNHCGVDYAGPFPTRIMNGRNVKTFKSYFSIFICLATKAVHIEAVGSLTAESFIGAFKRLASRRGIPSHMYSDNGTNFVGADRELRDMLESCKDEFAKYHTNQGTTWSFNPPSAPHQGGLWEAGVKSVKFHLKRVVGTTTLTFEEFQTVLAQIEACLNSRPLCAMSADPADYTALTPGHLLIRRHLTAVPEPDLTSLKMNRLSRWQLTSQIFQHFWRRWSSEYLSTLQQRFKWTSKHQDLQIGDLVLVKDDQLPPMKWKLGRVTQVFPGPDKCVRVVNVKTSEGEFKRPIVKLCPLLSSNE